MAIRSFSRYLLSKSRVMASRQCPRKLWLHIHHSELSDDDEIAGLRDGISVEEVARRLYAPKGNGILINRTSEGFTGAIALTKRMLVARRPIFEAGFASDDVSAFLDIVVPARTKTGSAWHVVEVKSSTDAKGYHREEAAFQVFVAEKAGLKVASVSVAHINRKFVYRRDGDFQGLLSEVDLTKESKARNGEVQKWISLARKIARSPTEPAATTGSHCYKPYACGFFEYCRSREPKATYPVEWLPRVQNKALKSYIEENEVIDMRQIPDDLLNERQKRVKAHSVSGTPYFDARGAKADLAASKPPFYFMDFETIPFGVPRWKGTRPYQQIPFQFSMHSRLKDGEYQHEAFLDLSGDDPSKPFAEALIDACGSKGSIFVYNAGFEGSRIEELSVRFRRLKANLQGIKGRLVDFLPIAEQRFYHPCQGGSWSIKKLLRAIAPHVSYEQLSGVQDGGMAMEAYLEAINPVTSEDRKTELRAQLLAYCKLDTHALVKVWEFFTNK